GLTLPGAVRPREAGRLAALAEQAGCDSVWLLDVRREPYLLAAAAAQATERVEIGTNVAVAFARSPTVTATAAWDLALSSGGRCPGAAGAAPPAAGPGWGPPPAGRRRRGGARAGPAAPSPPPPGAGGARRGADSPPPPRPPSPPGGDARAPPPPVYVAAVNPY